MVMLQVGIMAEVEIHFSSMQLPYAALVAKAILAVRIPVTVAEMVALVEAVKQAVALVDTQEMVLIETLTEQPLVEQPLVEEIIALHGVGHLVAA
tara:strand:- start:104 stop:388 length:285 start_codon:yes stop_codon:yes gene_type:complete